MTDTVRVTITRQISEETTYTVEVAREGTHPDNVHEVPCHTFDAWIELNNAHHDHMVLLAGLYDARQQTITARYERDRLARRLEWAQRELAEYDKEHAGE